MIREATHADIPRCVEIIRQSFRTVADDLGFTEENAPRFTAFATTEERLLYQMDTEKRPMFVYDDNGVLCGYYSLSVTDKSCELNNLAVLPSYRHRGIGRQLLEHAEKTAEDLGCDTMNLGIVEENTVLRRWYEQNGAVHTGTEKYDFFPFTCGYMKFSL